LSCLTANKAQLLRALSDRATPSRAVDELARRKPRLVSAAALPSSRRVCGPPLRTPRRPRRATLPAATLRHLARLGSAHCRSSQLAALAAPPSREEQRLPARSSRFRHSSRCSARSPPLQTPAARDRSRARAARWRAHERQHHQRQPSPPPPSQTRSSSSTRLPCRCNVGARSWQGERALRAPSSPSGRCFSPPMNASSRAAPFPTSRAAAQGTQ
jgi:hypothetical protein